MTAQAIYDVTEATPTLLKLLLGGTSIVMKLQ